MGIEIEGKECVIIGRSNIVGKPMAALLLRENATVTVAHSKTKDLKSIAKRADILIVAIGKAKFITKDYIKEGAVVIDVGMHRDEQNHLCGDVTVKMYLRSFRQSLRCRARRTDDDRHVDE